MRHREMMAATVCVFAGLASEAEAQWTFTLLAPAGSVESNAYAADGAMQGGSVTMSRSYRAAMWSGSAASWTNMYPYLNGESVIFGIDRGEQVGFFQSGSFPFATHWDGTPETMRTLGSNGARQNEATAVRDGMQVGHGARPSSEFHAGYWRGTSMSWVDLHPAGPSGSFAYATDGIRQGGSTYDNLSLERACIWQGTPESWVDLHPAGAVTSVVRAMTSTTEVGFAQVDQRSQASLWRSTRDSWQSLHPLDADESWARGAYERWQAGYIRLGTSHRAGLWQGTSESWVDLHSFCPDGYTQSRAYAISGDAENLYICGAAWGPVSGDRLRAVLWTRPRPCTGDFNGDNFIDFFDYAAFVERYELGDPDADFNTAGFVDFFDSAAFVEAFESGC